MLSAKIQRGRWATIADPVGYSVELVSALREHGWTPMLLPIVGKGRYVCVQPKKQKGMDWRGALYYLGMQVGPITLKYGALPPSTIKSGLDLTVYWIGAEPPQEGA